MKGTLLLSLLSHVFEESCIIHDQIDKVVTSTFPCVRATRNYFVEFFGALKRTNDTRKEGELFLHPPPQNSKRLRKQTSVTRGSREIIFDTASTGGH